MLPIIIQLRRFASLGEHLIVAMKEARERIGSKFIHGEAENLPFTKWGINFNFMKKLYDGGLLKRRLIITHFYELSHTDARYSNNVSTRTSVFSYQFSYLFTQFVSLVHIKLLLPKTLFNIYVGVCDWYLMYTNTYFKRLKMWLLLVIFLLNRFSFSSGTNQNENGNSSLETNR